MTEKWAEPLAEIIDTDVDNIGGERGEEVGKVGHRGQSESFYKFMVK